MVENISALMLFCAKPLRESSRIHPFPVRELRVVRSQQEI